MDKAAIQEQYGVSPRQLIDVKSLMGDTSDNIPGSRGSAKRPPFPWCRSSAAWRGCMSTSTTQPSSPAAGKPAGPPGGCKAQLHPGHHRTDAPISTDADSYLPGAGDKPAAVRLMQDLELRSLIGRLGLEDVAPAGDQPAPDAPPCPRPLFPPCPKSWRAPTWWRPALRSTAKRANKIIEERPAHWYAVRAPLLTRSPRRICPGCWMTPPFRRRSLTRRPSTPPPWPRGLGQLHHLGRQAGRLSAGRLGGQVQHRNPGRVLPDFPRLTCADWPDAPPAGGPLRQNEGGDHRPGGGMTSTTTSSSPWPRCWPT